MRRTTKTLVAAAVAGGLTLTGMSAAHAGSERPSGRDSATAYADSVRDAPKRGTIGVPYDSGVVLPLGYTWGLGEITHYVGSKEIPTVRLLDAGSGLTLSPDGRITGVPERGLTTSRTSTWQFEAIGIPQAGGPKRTISVRVKLQDPAPVVPRYNPSASYRAGDRVLSSGKVYVAVQSFRGNGDSNWINAASLWQLVG